MYEELLFVWDENKNKENLQRHGVDFNTAIHIFKDPNRVRIYDIKHSTEEDRWDVIGIAGDVVLFVVETEITDNIIRIISAGKANIKEKEAYNENNLS
jgi:uncharacterized DUF497 family protein